MNYLSPKRWQKLHNNLHSTIFLTNQTLVFSWLRRVTIKYPPNYSHTHAHTYIQTETYKHMFGFVLQNLVFRSSPWWEISYPNPLMWTNVSGLFPQSKHELYNNLLITIHWITSPAIEMKRQQNCENQFSLTGWIKNCEQQCNHLLTPQNFDSINSRNF